MTEKLSSQEKNVCHSETLLIFGASARAAAESARRGGFECVAIDLFQDLDLERACKNCLKVKSLDQIPQVVRSLTADVFMYAGCMENRPNIIRQMEKTGKLAGIGVVPLKKVRDPFWLAELGAKHGFKFAESRRILPEKLGDVWLQKPFNSCGGQRIELVDPAKSNAPNPRTKNCDDYYFQRHIAGQSISAAYVATAVQTKLLGISRQLVGESFLGAQPFSYCGSLSPYSCPTDVEAHLVSIGQTIAKEAELIGLFGLDLILTANGVTLLEVNPRYTASMEIVDYSRRISCVEQHFQACFGRDLPIDGPSENFVCKLIQFSNMPSRIIVNSEFTEWALSTNTSDFVSRLADIPPAGSEIDAGSPIFSVIGIGESETLAFNRARILCDIGHNRVLHCR